MPEYILKDDELAFSIVPTTIRQSKFGVSLQRYVNSITIINYGASIVTVNSTIILYPGTVGSAVGDSISFGGNKGEIFKGTIDIAFNLAVGNNCLILQKIYFPEYFKTKP